MFIIRLSSASCILSERQRCSKVGIQQEKIEKKRFSEQRHYKIFFLLSLQVNEK